MRINRIGFGNTFVLIFMSFLALGCAGNRVLNDEQVGAKNVILFIGDGMGVSTVTAARIFDGQSRGESGEENLLSFEQFPSIAMVKTYNTNQQVPDSAGTATAIHTGTKTLAGVINIGPDAFRRDCAGARLNRLSSLGELVKHRGMSLGIVTTTRLTHATPSTVFAHSPERDWESDRYLTVDQVTAGCGDIARQLAEFDVGGGIDIALGGGMREFTGSNLGGQRRDPDADLTNQWLQAAPNRRLIESRAELDSLPGDQNILGLFSSSHLTYVAERKADTTQPTIQEMTVAAIDYLEAQGTGYYLLVEGGRIDHGHHEGKPGYALLETQAFAESVALALDQVNLEDTLILVTADHSHAFTLSGYPTRGNPILGLVVENDLDGKPKLDPEITPDGQPYTSVGYANGPGAISDMPRPRPATNLDSVAQSLIPMGRSQIDGFVSNAETHGGEDVALYAIGAGADKVGGVIEQNRIFDIIVESLGLK